MKILNYLYYFILFIIFNVVGITSSFFINFMFVPYILFGNNEKSCELPADSSFFFDLFFEISGNTGYHPEPNLFYYFCTISFGLSFGFYLSYKYIWNRFTK